MAHPYGGKNRILGMRHTFQNAVNRIKANGGDVAFTTGANENIHATLGMTRDKRYLTIVYNGERSRHGNVCSSCWGYRVSCHSTRVGQCTEPFDRSW